MNVLQKQNAFDKSQAAHATDLRTLTGNQLKHVPLDDPRWQNIKFDGTFSQFTEYNKVKKDFYDITDEDLSHYMTKQMQWTTTHICGYIMKNVLLSHKKSERKMDPQKIKELIKDRVDGDLDQVVKEMIKFCKKNSSSFLHFSILVLLPLFALFL